MKKSLLILLILLFTVSALPQTCSQWVYNPYTKKSDCAAPSPMKCSGGNCAIGTTCPEGAPAGSVCANGKVYAGGVEVGGSGGLTCAKYTVAYTALVAADVTANATLFTLPERGKIVFVETRHSAAFTGTNLTSLTVSVGVGGGSPNYTRYASPLNIFQGTGDTVFVEESMPGSAQVSAHDVVAHFIGTWSAGPNFGNGSTTALTAGSVDVRVCTVVLP